MSPTRRFWILLALGIPIAALFTAAGAPLIAVGYDVLLLVALWSTSRLAPDLSRLRIVRHFDPVLSVRVANRITVSVEGDFEEALHIRLRDEPPGEFDADGNEFDLRVAPHRENRHSYRVTPPERGSYEFRGTYARVLAPLGLAYREVRLETAQPVRVYPNVLAMRRFDLLNQRGRLRDLGVRRSRMRGMGSEFESLRDYQIGDDVRKMDHKATARRGKPIVRQFEQERNQSVILVIDLGRHMLAEANGVRKMDHVLDAMLMLAHAAASAGDAIGLLVYGENVRKFLPPRKGRSQVGAVIDAAHDLVAEPLESDHLGAAAYLDARWSRRSLVVWFTDVEDVDRAADLGASLTGFARRHILALARVVDPALAEIRRGPAVELLDQYRRHAAGILLEERQDALRRIRRSGLETLEAEPQDLAAALVGFYFRTKDSGRL